MSYSFHPVVVELKNLIELNNWAADFETAIQNARSYKVGTRIAEAFPVN
jgi:hypothetical protein